MMTADVHDVIIRETWLTESNSGNLQIAVKYVNDADDTITDYMATADGALEYTLERLKRLGWDSAQYNHDPATLDGPESPLVGAKARIKVGEDTYNGKTSLKVVAVFDPNGPPPRQVGQHADKAADLRKRILLAKGPTPVTIATTPEGDDDVPF